MTYNVPIPTSYFIHTLALWSWVRDKNVKNEITQSNNSELPLSYIDCHLILVLNGFKFDLSAY